MSQEVKVIGVTGYAQHGKNTVAELIKSQVPRVHIIGLADALRAFVTLQNPIVGTWGMPPETLRYATAVEQFGYEQAKRNSEVRRILQATGTEAARTIFGPDCWVHALEHRISQLSGGVVVVPDVRFENEVDWVKTRGTLVAVCRLDAHNKLYDSGVDRSHPSEAYIPYAVDRADYRLVADSVAELTDRANACLGGILSHERVTERPQYAI